MTWPPLLALALVGCTFQWDPGRIPCNLDEDCPNDTFCVLGEEELGTCSETPDATEASCGSVRTMEGMDFVYVCAGSFEMGCPDEQAATCPDDEFPRHPVELRRNYWLARTPVTQDQWSAWMGNEPSYFGPDQDGIDCGGDCPVDRINWWEALLLANAMSEAAGLRGCYDLYDCDEDLVPGEGQVCTTVGINSTSLDVYGCEGYRLPAEAEWEYAALAGTHLLYAGSDDPNEVAWYDGNSLDSSHPTKSLAPNAFGLYDMSGNVWEWVFDTMLDEGYETMDAVDPVSTGSSLYRSCRGGSWFSTSEDARSVNRHGGLPDVSYFNFGLRIARTIY